jgi:hypothetical protein
MLLSEFLGNDSVYRFGYANPFHPDRAPEFYNLAELLSDIRSCLGTDDYNGTKEFSISYGYISPEVSEKIVRWKNPRSPSYHRWDDGAACDVNFHGYTFGPYYVAPDLDEGECLWGRLCPIGIADRIYSNLPRDHGGLDRMITYSESPYICLAWNQHAKGKWYENRFTGERGVKPLFLTHTGRSTSLHLPVPETADWRGGGWPSHHGGGRRQYHHIRTSMYTVMSDWLYDPIRVHNGRANKLPVSTTRHDWIVDCAIQAGQAFDHLQALANGHVPIIAGLATSRSGTSNWEENGGWSFTVAFGSDEDIERIVEGLRQNLEMYRITKVEVLEHRNYRTPDDTRRGPIQQRLCVEGVFDDDDERRFARRFHLDRAGTSPEFRFSDGQHRRDGDPDPERVSNARPGTQASDAPARLDRRRNLRTRVFRR